MSTVVLTGVSRGLGRAMAVGFAECGWTVFACSRSQQPIDDLQHQLGDSNSISVVVVSCDKAVGEWAKQCLERFGPPDLLINNAAVVNVNAPLWEVSSREFDTVMAVNVNGTANVIILQLGPTHNGQPLTVPE